MESPEQCDYCMHWESKLYYFRNWDAWLCEGCAEVECENTKEDKCD